MKLAPKTAALLVACTAALGVTGSAAADTSVKVVADPATGHVYELVGTGGRSWTSSRKHAAARTHNGHHGHLATITSRAEFRFYRSAFGSMLASCDPWLGGYQDPTAPNYSEPAGGWRWVTGEAWDFTAWAPGEPNDSGGEGFLSAWGGPRWNDNQDDGGRGCYLVEYEPGA